MGREAQSRRNDSEREVSEALKDRSKCKLMADQLGFSYAAWNEVEQYTKSLRDLIEASGFAPDYHVWISRGGIVPGVLLSHLMPWKPSFMVGVKGEGERRVVEESPHINWGALRDKNVLLVEDHLETGRSAIALKQHMEGFGARVKLACYSASPDSEIDPDFVIERGVNQVPIYPWEKFREPQPQP